MSCDVVWYGAIVSVACSSVSCSAGLTSVSVCGCRMGEASAASLGISERCTEVQSLPQPFASGAAQPILSRDAEAEVHPPDRTGERPVRSKDESQSHGRGVSYSPNTGTAEGRGTRGQKQLHEDADVVAGCASGRPGSVLCVDRPRLSDFDLKLFAASAAGQLSDPPACSGTLRFLWTASICTCLALLCQRVLCGWSTDFYVAMYTRTRCPLCPAHCSKARARLRPAFLCVRRYYRSAMPI